MNERMNEWLLLCPTPFIAQRGELRPRKRLVQAGTGPGSSTSESQSQGLSTAPQKLPELLLRKKNTGFIDNSKEGRGPGLEHLPSADSLWADPHQSLPARPGERQAGAWGHA